MRLLMGIALLIACSALAAEEGGPARMRELCPAEAGGWKAEGKDETYDRETVFQYIDGAAEVYLTYGFREVFVRQYAKPDAKPIVLEIYDLGSPADAYGIFSFEREEETREIGSGSEYAAGWLRFWKGRFFVSILIYPESPPGKAAVLELGKGIAAAIKEAGAPPELLGRLPQAGLLPNTVRYFHQHQILNYHYFVADENILHLGPDTEALLARYQRDGGKPYLLLVKYPDEAKAAAALKSFLAAYVPEAQGTGVARLENGKWTAAKAQGKLVAVVFDAPSGDSAAELLDAALRGLGGEKHE